MGRRSFMNNFSPAAKQVWAPVPGCGYLLDSACAIALRSIVRCDLSMKRIFSSSVAALAAGVCLRLFFALKHPAHSGDTVFSGHIAANWLHHHIYAMDVQGQLTAVDMRMPGYPAFLALIYAITERVGEPPRRWVLLAHAVLDLFTSSLIAGLPPSPA